MDKYINADDMNDILLGVANDIQSEMMSQANLIRMIATKLSLMPSADVVEVKHGHWIENDNGTYSCSFCQSWIPNEQYYYARYCLHCGADMREEKKGANNNE